MPHAKLLKRQHNSNTSNLANTIQIKFVIMRKIINPQNLFIFVHKNWISFK